MCTLSSVDFWGVIRALQVNIDIQYAAYRFPLITEDLQGSWPIQYMRIDAPNITVCAVPESVRYHNFCLQACSGLLPARIGYMECWVESLCGVVSGPIHHFSLWIQPAVYIGHVDKNQHWLAKNQQCSPILLKVWWHAATLFIIIYFYINRADIQVLYILLVEALLLFSWLLLGRGHALGCRAEIRTRACLTASRRTTVCSTPHPGVISIGRGRGKNASTDSLYIFQQYF